MNIPDEVIEVIGELPDDLTGKRAYFGFEPSGRLHKGILNPIAALRWVASKGAIPIVLVADVNSHLNEKTYNYEWENVLSKYLPDNSEIIIQSHYDYKILDKLMQIAQVTNIKRAVRAIDCAGREANETLDGVKTSSPIYALMQAADMKILDIDIAIGGIDQRKVHMLVRDVFPKLGWKVPTMIHTKILIDKNGNKMSKSNPETCEWL